MTSDAPALWRHPGFLKLWTAQAVSGFGARIAREGLPMTAVLLLKAPPAAMGALAAVGLGAYALVGLVAGPLADRLPGHTLLIAADLGRMAGRGKPSKRSLFVRRRTKLTERRCLSYEHAEG